MTHLSVLKEQAKKQIDTELASIPAITLIRRLIDMALIASKSIYPLTPRVRILFVVNLQICVKLPTAISRKTLQNCRNQSRQQRTPPLLRLTAFKFENERTKVLGCVIDFEGRSENNSAILSHCYHAPHLGHIDSYGCDLLHE